jgi:hypothetical protein
MNKMTVIKKSFMDRGYYYNPENNLVVKFLYFHNSAKTLKRVHFEIISIYNYPRYHTLPTVGNETFFVVNEDIYPCGKRTFRLSIDAKKRKGSLHLIEKPEVGYEWLTAEEKEGVIVNFKLNSFFTAHA